MKGADDAMTYEERIHQLQRFLREPVLYPIIERRAADIVENIRYCLTMYYCRAKNYTEDGDGRRLCEASFQTCSNMLRSYTEFVRGMMMPCIETTEDILLAVYGIGSNAVLLYREFIRLSEAYPDFRFDGCVMGAAAHAQLSYNLQLAICAPADTQAGVLPKL